MFRALLSAALAAAALAPAAHAHELGTHTGFVSSVSTLEPPIAGLLVRVVGGHDGLSLTNLTEKRVVIFDVRGEPLVEIAPGKTERWRDPRVGATEEPPAREGLVRNWRIAGTLDGRRFAIVGYLGYRPPRDTPRPEDGLPTWAIVFVGAGGALALIATALAVPLLRRRDDG